MKKQKDQSKMERVALRIIESPSHRKIIPFESQARNTNHT